MLSSSFEFEQDGIEREAKFEVRRVDGEVQVQKSLEEDDDSEDPEDRESEHDDESDDDTESDDD